MPDQSSTNGFSNDTDLAPGVPIVIFTDVTSPIIKSSPFSDCNVTKPLPSSSQVSIQEDIELPLLSILLMVATFVDVL